MIFLYLIAEKEKIKFIFRMKKKYNNDNLWN